MRSMTKPFKSKEFKALKDKWYSKLKSEGFKDAESFNEASGEDKLIKWDTHEIRVRAEGTDPEKFYVKQEYYYKAHQFLNNYSFKTQTDRHIWELHSEGYGFRMIAKSLAALGIKTYKEKVAKIVHRLKEAMREATIECKNETSLSSDLD